MKMQQFNMSRQLQLMKRQMDEKERARKRCIEFEKKLLIELATNERKAARTKMTANKMRIGQYVAARDNSDHHVERFAEGFAFLELNK